MKRDQTELLEINVTRYTKLQLQLLKPKIY